MRTRELLLEGAPLDAALRRGWVRIRYTRLDGMTRIMLATTNPKKFQYTYKRPIRLPPSKHIVKVWEHKVGWRALRRNRIVTWAEAGPVSG